MKYYKHKKHHNLIALDEVPISEAFVKGSYSYEEIDKSLLSNFKDITHMFYGNDLSVQSETCANPLYKNNVLDFIKERKKRETKDEEEYYYP